jgi:PAS domain S-box-containing protein
LNMAKGKSRYRALLIKALLFGLAYFASAEASWFFSSRYGTDVIYWIPAGLLVAALLIADPRDWAALLVAGAVVNVAFDLHNGTPFGMSLIYASVNGVQALVAAVLFQRFVSRAPRLNTIREFLGLVTCSVVIAAGFVGVLTAAALVLTGDTGSFGKSVALGWSGNGMAILTVAPFVLTWFRPRDPSAGRWASPRQLPEAALLVTGLFLFVYYLFVAGRGVLSPANFILVPFVLWAALRFGIRGASAATFLLALLLVYFASHYPNGPAEDTTSGSFLIKLYGFLAICSLVGLIPAIAVGERDQLVAQLGDSEERFRNLAAAANEGVIITEDGLVIDVNDQALKLFGYERVPEMVGLKAAEFISPEVRLGVAEAVEAERDVTFENRLGRRDGSSFQAEVQSKMMPFGDRRIHMTTVRDVSERKKAESLLNGQFDVLEMIAAGRSLPDIMAKLIGVIESQSEEMVGAVLMRDGDCLRLLAAPSIPDAYRIAIETIPIGEGSGWCGTAASRLAAFHVEDLGESAVSPELGRLAVAQGLRSCWSTPILDGKQRLIGTFALYNRQPGVPTPGQRQLIDVVTHTASVAISRHLDEGALKLSDFSVNQASTPTFWVTKDARIRRVNHAVCDTTGYPEAQLLTMRVSELLPGFRHEGWEAFWAESRRLKGRHFQTQYVFFFLHDITERRQLEDKLRQSQKMEAIGQLSGGIAHDFNNLLTVIQGNIGMMRLSGNFTSEVVELVDEIDAAIDRATKLTGQLLAFGRKQVMQSADVDLNSVVDGFSKMLRRVIGEAVDLHIDLAPPSLPVRADSAMVEQAMLNLCLNSRDAMPRGGQLTLATASVAIGPAEASDVPGARAGAFARLTVADTGIGIAPENIKHVFEPFFTTKEVGKGTGLGLASVYGIIQQHHGWISVRSDLGRGTTFCIYLPLIERAPAALLPGKASAAFPRGSETILLVEDDPAVRLVTNKALVMMGYRVLVAKNGNEAMDVWAAHRSEVQLLLTDMVMPGDYGGADIARIFTGQQPSLKVIFMSGYSADLAGTDFSSRMGGLFLGKPFEIAALASTIRISLSGGEGTPR